MEETKIVVTVQPRGLFDSYEAAERVSGPLSSSLSRLNQEGWKLRSVVAYRGVLQHYFVREVKEK